MLSHLVQTPCSAWIFQWNNPWAFLHQQQWWNTYCLIQLAIPFRMCSSYFPSDSRSAPHSLPPFSFLHEGGSLCILFFLIFKFYFIFTLAMQQGMWFPSSPTRYWTPSPCSESAVFTIELPRKLLYELYSSFQLDFTNRFSQHLARHWWIGERSQLLLSLGPIWSIMQDRQVPDWSHCSPQASGCW